MKILVINQHTSNHGDESALKGLISSLSKEKNIEEIGLLYNSAHELDNSEILMVDTGNVKLTHHLPLPLNIFDKLLIRVSLLIPLCLLKHILKFSVLGHELEIMSFYDLIINAPGGVNIGPYMDWRYLWRLSVSLKLKKKLGIFAISIGPFPENILFTYVAKKVLLGVDFISLRDKKSQGYAAEVGIRYFPTIDSAFLDAGIEKDLPAGLKVLLQKPYVVIVPNELYRWHPYFKNINPASLDNIYIEITNFFIKENCNVVYLPQLFGPVNNDKKYFEFLKLKTNNPAAITVVDDAYNSDIQQNIVKNAEFLVGARYHSIIFSIHNGVPFFALSYEHKILEMLELLNFRNYGLDIKDSLNERVDVVQEMKKVYEVRHLNKDIIKQGSEVASNIAGNAYSQFSNKFFS